MSKRVLPLVLALLLVGVVLTGTASAAGERSLSLSASKFGFSADPGQTGTGEVLVINEGTQPVSVRVYVADQVVSSDGTMDYVTPPLNVNTLNSPASWVTFKLPEDAKSTGNIPYIDLAPGERVPVTFSVTVPEKATPGDKQAVLFFETFQPQQTSEGGTTRTNVRIGARIKTRVNGELVEKMTVRPFAMPSFVIGKSPGYSFSVNNEGNFDSSVNARLVVLDRSENERSSSTVLTDTPVYAGTSVVKKGKLALPGLAFGSQHIRLIVSYVGDSGIAKSIEKDRNVWAIPLWLLVAFGALIIALVLTAVWIAASRSKTRNLQRGSVPEVSASAATLEDWGGDAG